MNYVLAIDPSGAEPTYYAGSKRSGIERKAERTTHLRDHATTFDTAEEAEELRKELAGKYKIIALKNAQ